MIDSLSKCYNIILRKAKERFTLTFITTSTPSFILTLLAFSTNLFYSSENIYYE